ncbi:hypothetical protein ILP97_17970 [Amycolatopsis sp. H6(2020)]|nr:hypothetical protein [Amycolatopsis sp. H6(2020)]
MFPFDQLGHAAKTLIREAEEASSALVRTAQEAADWAGDLFSGNVGLQAMPVPAVVDHVMAGNGSSWSAAGGQASEAATAHHEIAATLTAMLNDLEPAWTGEGALRAQQRTKAFSDLVERTGVTLNANGSNVTDAAYGFELARRSMEPMGSPPDKSFFDVATPWATDTEEAIEAYNAKAEKNLAIYNAYVNHLDNQGQGLSGDYGQMVPASAADTTASQQTDRGQVTGDRPQRTTAEKPNRTEADDTRASTSVDQHDRGTPSVDAVSPGTNASRGTDIDGREGVPSRDDQTEAAGHTPSPLGAGTRGPSSLQQPERGAGAPWPGSGDPALPAVPNSPPAPNRSARGGDAGALGSGPRKGAEQPGPGGRTAGGNRGISTRRAGEAPGVAPVGSRPGSPEDEEHQRKYVREDDSAFALADDELVDPRTGFAPAPPTIGT